MSCQAHPSFTICFCERVKYIRNEEWMKFGLYRSCRYERWVWMAVISGVELSVSLVSGMAQHPKILTGNSLHLWAQISLHTHTHCVLSKCCSEVYSFGLCWTFWVLVVYFKSTIALTFYEIHFPIGIVTKYMFGLVIRGCVCVSSLAQSLAFRGCSGFILSTFCCCRWRQTCGYSTNGWHHRS